MPTCLVISEKPMRNDSAVKSAVNVTAAALICENTSKPFIERRRISLANLALPLFIARLSWAIIAWEIIAKARRNLATNAAKSSPMTCHWSYIWKMCTSLSNRSVLNVAKSTQMKSAWKSTSSACMRKRNLSNATFAPKCLAPSGTYNST